MNSTGHGIIWGITAATRFYGDSLRFLWEGLGWNGPQRPSSSNLSTICASKITSHPHSCQNTHSAEMWKFLSVHRQNKKTNRAHRSNRGQTGWKPQSFTLDLQIQMWITLNKFRQNLQFAAVTRAVWVQTGTNLWEWGKAGKEHRGKGRNQGNSQTKPRLMRQ